MKLHNKRVLITGGAGYIGSNLAKRLCARNSVTILDNLSAGKFENIVSIIDKINFIRGDVRNRDDVSRSLEDIDIVFHMAATNLLTSLKDPGLDLSVCLFRA